MEAIMKMSKEISKRFGIIFDWMSIIFGVILFSLHFFKIVPGFGSTAALAATVIIAVLGPMGLIMVILAAADLLKDRFFISGPEEDDYYEDDNYCEEDDDNS